LLTPSFRLISRKVILLFLEYPSIFIELPT